MDNEHGGGDDGEDRVREEEVGLNSDESRSVRREVEKHHGNP